MQGKWLSIPKWSWEPMYELVRAARVACLAWEKENGNGTDTVECRAAWGKYMTAIGEVEGFRKALACDSNVDVSRHVWFVVFCRVNDEFPEDTTTPWVYDEKAMAMMQ